MSDVSKVPVFVIRDCCSSLSGHHSLSGSKQHKCIFFSYGGPRSKMVHIQTKPRHHRGFIAFGASRGESSLSFFQLSGVPCLPCPLALSPFSDHPLLDLPASLSHFARILVVTLSPKRMLSLYLNNVNYTCQVLLAT